MLVLALCAATAFKKLR